MFLPCTNAFDHCGICILHVDSKTYVKVASADLSLKHLVFLLRPTCVSEAILDKSKNFTFSFNSKTETALFNKF